MSATVNHGVRIAALLALSVGVFVLCNTTAFFFAIEAEVRIWCFTSSGFRKA